MYNWLVPDQAANPQGSWITSGKYPDILKDQSDLAERSDLPRHIQEGLVHGDRLHLERELLEEGANLPAEMAVQTKGRN